MKYYWSWGFYNWGRSLYNWSRRLDYGSLGRFWSTSFNFTRAFLDRLFLKYFFFIFLRVGANRFFSHYHCLFFSLRSWSFLASFLVFLLRIWFITFIVNKSFSLKKVLFPFSLLNLLYLRLLDRLRGFRLVLDRCFVFFVDWIIFIKLDEEFKHLLTSNKLRIKISLFFATDFIT